MKRVLPSLCVLALVVPFSLQAQDKSKAKDVDAIPCRVIYVPTDVEVVEKMLDMANVNKDMTDILRSINRMVDLANADKKKKMLPPLVFKDIFAGKLTNLSDDQRKELADALAKVNQAIDKINADNTRPAPHFTMAEVLSGKCDYAAPSVVALLKRLQEKSDVVYDLGCGDGRIVCIAATKYGARGVGVDIDPERIKDCAQTMKKYNVSDKEAEFRLGDALKVKDLNKASVITFYMLPEFMEKLEPQVLKLKPGTRLVAHDYPFPNLKPDLMVEFKGPYREHTLYLWTLREAGKDPK